MSTDSPSVADFPSTIAEQEGDEVAPADPAEGGQSAARSPLAAERKREEGLDDASSDGGKQDGGVMDDEGDITMRLKGIIASEFSQPDDNDAASEDGGLPSEDGASGAEGLLQGEEEKGDTTARQKPSDGYDDDDDDYRSELSEDEAVAASLAYA